jgi:hypothetical protein
MATTKTDEKVAGQERPPAGVAPLLEADEILKVAPQQLDYSGAHEKIDAREIALVRKLDWWIMPILWGMYWLNYLVSLLNGTLLHKKNTKSGTR